MALMSRRRIGVSLVAALLVAWHGALLSLPHVDHGERVKIDVARCSATAADTPEFHLHAVVRELPRSRCLACLVASTFAVVHANSPSPVVLAVVTPRVAGVRWHPAGSPLHLPQLRAPPTFL
jgi:hypothetical protein